MPEKIVRARLDDASRLALRQLVSTTGMTESEVVRTALVDAASVSSLITTSEAVIVEAPEDKKPAAAYPPAPDMY